MAAGRRAPLLGEDDKLLRDGWLGQDENSTSGYRTAAASPDPLGDSPAGADATAGASPGRSAGDQPAVRDNGVDSRSFGRATPAEDEPSALGKPFPLAGVRILDFSWFLASAGATRFLAALGADVIKVEWKTHPDSGRGSLVPEGGRAARAAAGAPVPALKDPGIGGQCNKNPGKRGLSLNVADPRGLAIARRRFSTGSAPTRWRCRCWPRSTTGT